MSDNNKNLTSANAAAEPKAAAVVNEDPALISSADIEAAEEEENPYLVTFKKPFLFEGETYTEVDLSGLEDLTARDMIQAQRVMEKSGSVNVIPEMSIEYACIFASRATKYPVEFFQSLPPREAIKVKNKVTNFFYGDD